MAHRHHETCGDCLGVKQEKNEKTQKGHAQLHQQKVALSAGWVVSGEPS